MSATVRPGWMEKPKPLTQAAKVLALLTVVLLVCVPFLVIVSTSLASQRRSSQAAAGCCGRRSPPCRPTGTSSTAASSPTPSASAPRSPSSAPCSASPAPSPSPTRSPAPACSAALPALLLILFTFLFPPGMIPNFLLVKELGLLDSYASLIFPVLINVFNLVVLRGFFQGIPEELYEAARLDGAGDLRVLWTVVLPLSKAALAVVGLFYAVAYWNSWFYASLYLESDHWPLQQVLRTYVISGVSMTDTTLGDGAVNAPQTIQMAVLVIATVPILLVYPFLQKYFTKGVLTGAIKS